MQRNVGIAAILAFVCLAVGCGDGDDGGGRFDFGGGDDGSGGAARSLSATPSLGQIRNAAVRFYRADGVTLIASGDTGDSGRVTINPGNYRGPVIVEVIGDDVDASYFDEASGSLVAFGAGNSLRALLPGASGAIGVTPLTDIAYRAAVAQNLLPVSATVVNQLNTIVREALAPGLSSILSVPSDFNAATTSGSLNDDEAGRYALVLAALAQLSNGNASPALATLSALVADLVDGVIDGQNNGTTVTGATYGSNFINAMTAALNGVAASFGSSALQANAAAQAPASTTVDTSSVNNGGGEPGGNGQPNGETVPATINAALVGTFDLIYAENTAGGPFTDGQNVQVVVGSDSSLTLPGGKKLTGAFNRSFGTPNEFEIIWLDADTNLEYALSDNKNGNFNEINVGDAANPQASNGIPGFLGQLKMEEVDTGVAPPELAAIANQSMATVVSRNGNFSGNNADYALDDMLLINIDSDSVVTVDDKYVFDPAAADYQFFDMRSASSEAYYRVQTGDSENSQSFDIIFPDADSNTPIAWRLRMAEKIGAGSFRISSLEMELRPLPSAITGFFAAMNSDSPVALTAISVPGGGGPGGFQECSAYKLITDDGAPVNSSNSKTPFRYQLKTDMDQFRDSEIYRRSNTRFTDDGGNNRLEFQRNAILRRTDGFIDVVNLDAQNNEKARLTNDPAQISAKCGGGSSSAEFGPEGGGAFRFRDVDYVATGTDVSWTGDVDEADTGNQHNTEGNFTVNDGEFGLDRLKVMPSLIGVAQECRNSTNSPGPQFQDTYLGLKLVDNTGTTYVAGVLDPDRTSCSVTVTEITDTGFKGIFTAQVSKFLDKQSPVYPVTNGTFEHIDEAPTGGGAQASFRVGNVNPSYTQIACSAPDNGLNGLKVVLGKNEVVLNVADYGASNLASPSEYVSKRFDNTTDTSRHFTLQAYVAEYNLNGPVYAANSSQPLLTYTSNGGVQRVVGDNIPVEGRSDTMAIDVTCPSD